MLNISSRSELQLSVMHGLLLLRPLLGCGITKLLHYMLLVRCFYPKRLTYSILWGFHTGAILGEVSCPGTQRHADCSGVWTWTHNPLHHTPILVLKWIKQSDVFIIYPDLSDWCISVHSTCFCVSVISDKAVSETLQLSVKGKKGMLLKSSRRL